jgi:hypothetical protein
MAQTSRSRRSLQVADRLSLSAVLLLGLAAFAAADDGLTQQYCSSENTADTESCTFSVYVQQRINTNRKQPNLHGNRWACARRHARAAMLSLSSRAHLAGAAITCPATQPMSMTAASSARAIRTRTAATRTKGCTDTWCSTNKRSLAHPGQALLQRAAHPRPLPNRCV